jgi:hypothetical protein
MKLGFRVAASLSFCFALTVFEASTAHAFCRTNSCDSSRGEVCTLDDSGCRQGGVDLIWASSCVTFAVQKDGSKRNEIGADAFEQVINTAFDTWMQADCGGGTHPSIVVGSHGQVVCDKVEYTKGGNANIYMFRDDKWLASGPGNALALTTVWYDWHTGKIYDADVEVNGTIGSPDPNDPAYSQRITNGAPEDGADLPSIITHESGHFLGLDHAPFNPGATMFTFYEPGAGNLRVLSDDDQAGICAIYPADRTAESDNCDPRHGFSSKCYVPATDSGCALKSSGAYEGTRGPWIAFALGLSALFGARRLRRRKR